MAFRRLMVMRNGGKTPCEYLFPTMKNAHLIEVIDDAVVMVGLLVEKESKGES